MGLSISFHCSGQDKVEGTAKVKVNLSETRAERGSWGRGSQTVGGVGNPAIVHEGWSCWIGKDAFRSAGTAKAVADIDAGCTSFKHQTCI